MPPKKGKKGEAAEDPDAVKAVDRTFYELTINDLNLKLANLRAYNVRTDERNIELEAQMKQLEEDRTDVTAYLDRTLQLKTNVNVDLEEKLSELAKVRASETTEFKRQIREQELKYKTMQDELTSEIKLLTGKLNSLEEFRIQKDELMAKFDQQEDELRIQTKNHRELIYDIERKQVIDKDRMKKEVENRLLQLSNAFAKSNEIRISAHVQRLVRENIALNNELDRMMFSQRRLQNEKNAMEEETAKHRSGWRTLIDERDHLVRRSDAQLEVIRKLTAEFEQIQSRNAVLSEATQLRVAADRRALSATKQQQELLHKVKLLEQHLQAARSECARHQTLYKQQTKEMERLAGTLLKLKWSIKSAMRGEQNSRDHPEFRAAQRKNLLGDLMSLLVKVRDPPQPVSSFETVPSVDEIYRSGDIGISPKMSIGSLLSLRRPLLGRLHKSRQNIAEMMEDKEQQIAAAGLTVYESCPIIDLDSGSALLLSESSAGEAVAEDEQGLDDEDHGVSSSEDELQQPPAAVGATAAPGAASSGVVATAATVEATVSAEATPVAESEDGGVNEDGAGSEAGENEADDDA